MLYQTVLVTCLVIVASVTICFTDAKRQKKRGLPDISAGVDCTSTPGYREYCDRYGSGQVKSCSPCSLDNLLNPLIDKPEECADLPCPFHCPEGLDVSTRAPDDSCDVTTTAITTTTTATTTEAPTITESTFLSESTTSNHPFSTTEKKKDTPSYNILGIQLKLIIACVVIVIIVAVAVAVAVAWKCLKTWRLRNVSWRPQVDSVLPSPTSGDPLIDFQGVEMSSSSASSSTTPPSSPLDQIKVDGRAGAIHVELPDPDFVVKLACECDHEEVSSYPGRASLEGLLMDTRYDVLIGKIEEGQFREMSTKLVRTTGKCDVEKCSMTLHECREDMKSNFCELRICFSKISTRELLRPIIQVLCTENARGRAQNKEACVMEVKRLLRVKPLNRWEEILQIDSERRPDQEESLRVYELLNSLLKGMNTVQDVQVGDIVKIASILSKRHSMCISCQHVVHQFSRLQDDMTSSV